MRTFIPLKHNLVMDPILNEHNKEEYPPMHTAEHILNATMVRLFGCPRSRNAHIERKKSKCDYQLPEAPTPEQVEDFWAMVRAAEIQITIRNPRGRDILAACGQLAYKKEGKEC